MVWYYPYLYTCLSIIYFMAQTLTRDISELLTDPKSVLLYPNKILENESKARTLLQEDRVEGWINIVRYLDKNGNEKTMVDGS